MALETDIQTDGDASTKGVISRERRAPARLARMLAQSQTVRRMLRRVIWAGGSLEILEAKGRSANAHQMRWAQALEMGSALPLFPKTPKEMRPESFAEHWRRCDCPFWQWFQARGIEGEVRTVLDVGCGNGYTTEHFLRGGFDVVGVTVSPHEKSECRARGISVLEEDFHFLSVRDALFDLVFSSHSLEHSVSPLFALWEWKRVTRPGGYLLIAIPMPIERDARAAFPDHYDPETDLLDLYTGIDEVSSPDVVRVAEHAYGALAHVFVLSYWQLRWLFHLAGLELIADAVEDPVTNELIGTEHVDGRVPRDPLRSMNGLFLLRKPASARLRDSRKEYGQTEMDRAQ